MTDAAKKYLELEQKLIFERWNNTLSIEDEGKILYEMADIWYDMTEEEMLEADERAKKHNQPTITKIIANQTSMIKQIEIALSESFNHFITNSNRQFAQTSNSTILISKNSNKEPTSCAMRTLPTFFQSQEAMA